MEIVIVLSEKNMYDYSGEVLGYTLGNRRLTQTNKKQVYMVTHLKLSSIIRQFCICLAYWQALCLRRVKLQIFSLKSYIGNCNVLRSRYKSMIHELGGGGAGL